MSALRLLVILADLFAAPGGPVTGRDPGDVAFLFTSSGTSGMPKTVVHSHTSMTAFLGRFAAVPSVSFTPQDTVAVVVPFAQLFGWAPWRTACGAAPGW